MFYLTMTIVALAPVIARFLVEWGNGDEHLFHPADIDEIDDRFALISDQFERR